jgi:hypothetical protein
MGEFGTAPEVPWDPKQWLRITLRGLFPGGVAHRRRPEMAAGLLDTYQAGLAFVARGQPGWLHPWFHFWARLQRPDVAFLRGAHRRARNTHRGGPDRRIARLLTYTSGFIFSLLDAAGRAVPS